MDSVSNASQLPAGAGRDELLAELTVHHVEGVGPRLRQALLERFGNLSEALRARPQQLREVPGFGPRLIARWRKQVRDFDAEAFLTTCAEANLACVALNTSGYPHLLREIPDAPAILYMRGELQAADELAIAIVGTRRASSYGVRQAERFAAGLSRAGFTIVSGLARGIDGAAHQAALAAGGRTVAVLGSGLQEIYPPEHLSLAEQVAAQGAVLSELRPTSRPRSGSFPRRNRLISGLSLAVLVIEAAPRSGALITARHAVEQNREVFALPGRIDELNSRGCHALIRDGAKLVENVDDIIDELGPLAAPCTVSHGQTIHQPQELKLDEQEQLVLQVITEGSPTIDELVSRTSLPIQRILATLSVLEMKRLIRRLEGNRVTRRTVR